METSELIAMIREGAKGCDPGDTMVFPETGKIISVAELLEVANRLGSLNQGLIVTRLQRDQARQMRERAERLLGLVRSAPVAHGTNYQKIKNMGPLHLTEWILKTVHPCECCDKQGVCGIPEDEVNDEYCAEHILLWLMQEVSK